jgi:uncharacterized membrane-anchored protein
MVLACVAWATAAPAFAQANVEPAAAPLDPPAVPADGDQPATGQEAGSPATLDSAGIAYQTTAVTLADSRVVFTPPSGWGYIDPATTEEILVAWGNPPGQPTLGMLLRHDVPLEDDRNVPVILEYSDDGHVSDEDAEDIDYADLLEEMKEATQDSNAERTQQGFPAITLEGWAEPPHYDVSQRTIYWARRLRFAGQEAATVNYDARILGREGVFVLSAIGDASTLEPIRAVMPGILAATRFQDGHRYQDFDESTDRVAEYGLAGLVAAGLATKGGFFKVLLAGLLAAKKLVLAGLVAVGLFIRKLLGRRGDTES